MQLEIAIAKYVVSYERYINDSQLYERIKQELYRMKQSKLLFSDHLHSITVGLKLQKGMEVLRKCVIRGYLKQLRGQTDKIKQNQVEQAQQRSIDTIIKYYEDH